MHILTQKEQHLFYCCLLFITLHRYINSRKVITQLGYPLPIPSQSRRNLTTSLYPQVVVATTGQPWPAHDSCITKCFITSPAPLNFPRHSRSLNAINNAPLIYNNYRQKHVSHILPNPPSINHHENYGTLKALSGPVSNTASRRDSPFYEFTTRALYLRATAA